MEDASHRHPSRTTMHCWNTQWLCMAAGQRTRRTSHRQRLDPLAPLTRTLWTASLFWLSMVSYIFPSAPSLRMESGFLTRTNSESKELLPDLAGLSLSDSSKLSHTVILKSKPLKFTAWLAPTAQDRRAADPCCASTPPSPLLLSRNLDKMATRSASPPLRHPCPLLSPLRSLRHRDDHNPDCQS
jgi:hypothetical protein